MEPGAGQLLVWRRPWEDYCSAPTWIPNEHLFRKKHSNGGLTAVPCQKGCSAVDIAILRLRVASTCRYRQAPTHFFLFLSLVHPPQKLQGNKEFRRVVWFLNHSSHPIPFPPPPFFFFQSTRIPSHIIMVVDVQIHFYVSIDIFL